jgi:hypothetical protein
LSRLLGGQGSSADGQGHQSREKFHRALSLNQLTLSKDARNHLTAQASVARKEHSLRRSSADRAIADRGQASLQLAPFPPCKLGHAVASALYARLFLGG